MAVSVREPEEVVSRRVRKFDEVAKLAPIFFTPGKGTRHLRFAQMWDSSTPGSARTTAMSDAAGVTPPSARSTIQDVSAVSKRGLLLKEGHMWKAWRRRWFKLDGQLLFYFELATERAALYLEGLKEADECREAEAAMIKNGNLKLRGTIPLQNAAVLAAGRYVTQRKRRPLFTTQPREMQRESSRPLLRGVDDDRVQHLRLHVRQSQSVGGAHDAQSRPRAPRPERAASRHGAGTAIGVATTTLDGHPSHRCRWVPRRAQRCRPRAVVG